MNTLPTKTAYFTFGQSHIHHFNNGKILNKDDVIEITTPYFMDPRDVMFVTFKDKWAMEYNETPNEQFYPKGVSRIFMDGDMWCAVNSNFENLQESPAGFGVTPREALDNL